MIALGFIALAALVAFIVACTPSNDAATRRVKSNISNHRRQRG
mgnify:CR=1 FL=1